MHAFGLNIKMLTDCLMVLKNLELTVNAHAINSPIKGLHRQSSSTISYYLASNIKETCYNGSESSG